MVVPTPFVPPLPAAGDLCRLCAVSRVLLPSVSHIFTSIPTLFPQTGRSVHTLCQAPAFSEIDAVFPVYLVTTYTAWVLGYLRLPLPLSRLHSSGEDCSVLVSMPRLYLTAPVKRYRNLQALMKENLTYAGVIRARSLEVTGKNGTVIYFIGMMVWVYMFMGLGFPL